MSGIPALKDGEAGGSGVQADLQLHSELKTRLGYRRLWLKESKQKEVKKPIPGTIIWSEALGGNYDYYIAKQA